jgi:hypothetical protein
MNVLVRNKRGEKGTRHRRQSPGALLAPRSPARATHQPQGPVDDGSPERRHLHGQVEDSATYTCQCGYVFEALVSTTVDCPHCGDGQAW